jgi:hypothetical protein
MSGQERVIVEIRQGSDVIGFYVVGDKVTFHCYYTSPDPDEGMDIYIEEEFAIDDYRKGIEELVLTGKCAIKGKYQLLTITIPATLNRMSLDIGNALFCVGWDVDCIALPPDLRKPQQRKFMVEYTAATYWNDPDGDDFTPDVIPQEPFEIEADSLKEAAVKAVRTLAERTITGAKAVDSGAAKSYESYVLTRVSPSP